MTFDYSLDFSTIVSESNLNSTGSVGASRGYFSWNPTRVKYCLIGNSKRHKWLATQLVRSIRCFSTIKHKTTLGMDMARKFLQMGYTRSRRYANHKSGRKYAAKTKELLPREEDHDKALSAQIFYQSWQKAGTDKKYLQLRNQHRKLYENTGKLTNGEISSYWSGESVGDDQA